MTKIHQDVKFHHHNSKISHKNRTFSSINYNPSSHELDANAMRNILALLTKKTNEMKNKQKENSYHKYEGVYRESDNIDKPPAIKEFDPRDLFDILDQKRQSIEINKNENLTKSNNERNYKISNYTLIKNNNNIEKLNKSNENYNSKISNEQLSIKTNDKINDSTNRGKMENIDDNEPSSVEVFGEVMRKIISQGEKGQKLFQQLLNEIDDEKLKQRLAMKLKSTTKIENEKKRKKRDFILSSPLHDELNRNDEDDDAAIEEVIK